MKNGIQQYNNAFNNIRIYFSVFGGFSNAKYLEWNIFKDDEMILSLNQRVFIKNEKPNKAN